MIYGDLNSLDSPYLRVSWKLINLCPNKCWYCITPKNNQVIPSKTRVLQLLKRLFSYNYSYYDFYLLGGEPTLYPYLDFVIDNLSQEKRVRNIYVLTTDEYFRNDKVKSILTIHPSSKKKIDILDLSSFYRINLILDTPFLQKTLELKNKLTQYDVEFCHIKQPPDFISFLPFPDIKTPVMDSYKGLFCLHGTTCINIEPNLQLQGAVCSNSRRFYPEIVRCSLNSCDCDSNKHIIKTTNFRDAQKCLNIFKNKIKMSFSNEKY